MRSSQFAVSETHSGVVFFVGDRAYKLKKPVDLGFLDFTSRESREDVCHKEVALNRRLCPDVYLGVADVMGPDGKPCDHLVVMRRMPENRRMSTLVERGEPLGETVKQLARKLATFHARAERGPEISAEGSRDAIRRRWEDSFAQVRPFHGAVLEPGMVAEIEQLTKDFLAGREELFKRRMECGRVVDGHGDILADDIFCLEDGPRVLDCLEFDDRLRWLDALDDVAFLAMDLERLGAGDLGNHLLDWYAEYSGDAAPPALRHHYIAYRAFVRAKVACLRHDQGDSGAARLARGYASLALRHLRQGVPRLILVGGLPGSGKSTVGGAIADRLGGTVLRSDRIRKEMAGLSPEKSAAEEYGEGLYDSAHTTRTYHELCHRAGELLRLGETVVLDASWTSVDQRAIAAETAAETHSRLVQLRCWAPETITAQRIAERGTSLSDATPDIARQMAGNVHPWPAAHTILTAGTEHDSLTQALAYIESYTD
ncbi:bifunctional aminoglycoside phosphotransferase/ATP-binding protein [Amycolatopsis pigmentata]|uniref:AAA family ATPase n=1 Tax=Amycolatopsis pigmentata TaxID=450801 RepID=A0ABW5G0F1_9PSEU